MADSKGAGARRAQSKATSSKGAKSGATTAKSGGTKAKAGAPQKAGKAAAVEQPTPSGPSPRLVELMKVGPEGTGLSERTTEELWELYREEAGRVAREHGLRRFSASEPAASGEGAAQPEQDADASSDDAPKAEAAPKPQDAGAEPAAGTPETKPSRSPALKDLPKSPELEALRNELLERYSPLVKYIAERLQQTLPKSIELDDLISAGHFGLMDAIRGFDPNRGIKFKTYCSTRVRGSILDQLRSQDWVPRLVRLRASKIERAYQRLTGEFGREPTHAELARELEMDHGELTNELQHANARAIFSLSEKWDDDDDGSVEKVEIIEDHDAIDPVLELHRQDLMKYITRSLTHKERFIIEQYYQFGHTMREIGEMLALTESRVCQIHSNVMGRLKQLLGGGNDNLAS